MKNKAKYLAFFAILIGLVIWSLFVFYYGAENFVNLIGVQNGYLLAFVSAAIGGSSLITTSFFYATIATLGAGGLHPLALGILGGLGIGTGDIIFYFLGKKGRHALPEYLDKKIDPIDKWVHQKRIWTVPIFLFLYSAFTPLPNDVVTALLAAIKVPFRLIIIPLILGNVVFITLITYGVSFF